jgi:phosphate transport system substrate-binding protein
MKTELGTIDVRPIEFAACRDKDKDKEKDKDKDKDKYKDKERDKPGVISVPIGEGERFGIFGSNTISERLMPALIKAYGQREGLVAYGETCDDTFRLRSGKWVLSIECRSDGTRTGIPALAEGRADIAMLSRPITAKEKEQMARAGYSKMDTAKHEAVIALDGLLVLVSPQNPVRALSLGQIAKVFAGEITDWAQLGGAPGRIAVHARDAKSGTRDSFEALVMMPNGKAVSPAARQHKSSSELSDAVAADPRAIGFVGFAYKGGARALAVAQECGLVHQPSALEIKTEDYPLSRRLFLYTAKVHSINSHSLAEYAVSDAAQPVIESAGYVNQAISGWSVQETKARVSAYAEAPLKEAELDFDEALTRQLRRDAERAERLSVSFRFRPSSAKLDTKASQDVLRLAAYVQANGKRVLLVGFADAKGTFKENLRLSQERADEVRKALVESGGLSTSAILTKGYSELMPVACNGDDAGREKNRRVEAWLIPN